MTHRIVVNVQTGQVDQVEFTAQEQADYDIAVAEYVEPTKTAPTKEELMAKLEALQTQIQSLE